MSDLEKRLRSHTPEAIARAFHECYESLAPHFGYETRRESRVPWEQVPDGNKALMVATVRCALIETLGLLPTATEAADYIAQLEKELAEAKNPDVRTVVAYEAGYEDGKREAEAERDRLRDALEKVARTSCLADEEMTCDPRRVAQNALSAAALDQTGADK